MADDIHHRNLERAYAKARCNEYFAPRLRVSDGAAEVVIPVQSRFFHAFEAVHGSVYFKALDDAAYFAANSLVADVFLVTASFTVYMTRPVTEGEMIARGRVTHRSRGAILAESTLVDSAGRTLALGNGSFVRSEIPLPPSAG